MGMESLKMYCPSRCRNSNTPFHGGQYRHGNRNMRNFGPTNPHGSAFPQEEYLHQKETTGMENKKRNCSSPWKNPTYLCGSANYPVSYYIKWKLRVWRAQKCIALVCRKTPPTCADLQATPFHGWQYRAEKGNMRNFGPPNPHGTAFAPKQWLYQKEATGMESSKMYWPSRCRNSTYQCGAAY